MKYSIRRAPVDGELSADWTSPLWREIAPLSIDQFHPAGSEHQPQTQAKLAYTPDALLAIFRVRDRYVKSLCTQYQEMVCHDSCVESFIRPNLARQSLQVRRSDQPSALGELGADWGGVEFSSTGSVRRIAFCPPRLAPAPTRGPAPVARSVENCPAWARGLNVECDGSRIP